jgi:hypothetical protein
MVLRSALPLLFFLLPVMVQAQNTSEGHGLYVTIIEPQEDGRVGEIVHHNREIINFTPTATEEFFEWETEVGLIVLRLLTTKNNTCEGPNRHGCPDTLTVWELPEGIFADSLEVVTPENETSIITLFIYTGL